MLTIYRRHRSTCPHHSRKYKKCSCPIWVQGLLDGSPVRYSLDMTSWEAANRKVHELEVHGEKESVSVEEACKKFLADAEARNLSKETIKKYKYVTAELKEKFSGVPVHSVSVDDLRSLRNGWKFAGSTARKRVEYLRAFFAFCVASGWMPTNPGKPLKLPKHTQAPTLPFSDAEWRDIVTALGLYGDIHKQTPATTCKQLRALVLVMRYSGLRISDAVSLKRDRVSPGKKGGRLFLYQAKTGQPVWIPISKEVIAALADCTDDGPNYFWPGAGTLQTAQTKWQSRLHKLFKIAGIPDGHSHRFRDTFAVDLLSKGVSLETVSTLLGHTSIATTEKHYAPWVQSRQDALEEAVKRTW
jgi:integrase/recombinase XerD